MEHLIILNVERLIGMDGYVYNNGAIYNDYIYSGGISNVVCILIYNFFEDELENNVMFI
jgi:hypothetical protein